MAVLAHQSLVTEPLRQRTKPSHRLVAMPAIQSSVDEGDQRGGLSSVVDIAIGTIAAAMSAIVQFSLYAISVISFPFLPFVLPLLAAPVLIAFSLFVLAVGAVTNWLF